MRRVTTPHYHKLVTHYFTRVERPTDIPEQRAYALLALLDDAELRDIVPCYPSGRLDAFVDLGNPMKGVNLFPYLQRYREGRALRAVGPSEWLELSRTVGEVAKPARWPHEVY